MDKDIYILVEQYLNGDLDKEQTLSFEARLKTDQALAEELQLRKEMQQYLVNRDKKAALEDQLNEIGNDYFDESKPEEKKVVPINKNRWTRWIVAASILFALSLGLYWLLSSEASNDGRGPLVSFGEDIFQQFAKHETLNLTKKNNDQNVLINSIELAFNQEKYSDALPLINQLLEERTDDLQLLMTKSICLIETDELESARNILEPISSGSSAFKTEAKWYLALGYVKIKDYTKALSILDSIPSSDPFWFTKADRLKRALQSGK